MLTIYFSPHMTSVDNEAGRASGHADVPLAERGRQEAARLGIQYAAIPLDAVFCDDLQRATATAEIAFGGRGVPIVPDARLRECHWGALTQGPPAALDEEAHLTVPYAGGESLAQVVERVGACLREALRDYDGKTIAVIGHKVTKYGIVYWCGNESLRQIVRGPWEWLDVPIWRYELRAGPLDRPLEIG
jgi:broad specificity phosphatase PhoE